MGLKKRLTRNFCSRLAVPGGLGLLILLFLWKILLTNLILAGVDLFTYFYPYRDYAAAALRQFKLPLWNPYLFLGVPFLANSQAAVFYPLHWPLAWLTAPKQIAFSIGLHIFLGGLWAYLYARRSLKATRWGAFIGAAVFSLSGFIGAQVEHINQLNTAIWLPLLLLLWDEREKRRNLMLAGVVVALMLLAGHTQAAYICLFGWGLYVVLGEVKKGKSWPRLARRLAGRLALYALIVALGAGLAAVQLAPTLELSQLSNRAGGMSYQEASSFSLRPQLLPYTLLPAFGEDLAQVFGGESFSEYIAYLGLLGLFVALIGALFRPDSSRRTRLIVLLGTGLFLAAGRANPLYFVLYKIVPAFSLFRAPARWMLLYTFGGAMLAALGADFVFAPLKVKAQMTGHPGAKFSRWAWRRLLIGGGIVALPLALFSPWLDFPARPTLLAWAALSLAALFLWINALSARADCRLAKAALLILLLSELFAAGRGLAYNRATAPEALSSLRTAPAHLLAEARFGGQTPPSRFLGLSDILYDPGDLADIQALLSDQLPPEAIYDFVVAAKRKEILAPNLSLYYRLPGVDGYGGGLLPLKRYVTLQRLFLDADKLSPDGRLREQLQQVPEGRLLSMLNVKYVITDKVHDVWIDDVFYDLEHEAVLGKGAAEQITLTDLPNFDATALGIVSRAEGGEAVVELTIVEQSGQTQRRQLRLGAETGQDDDLATRLPLDQPAALQSITLRYAAPAGRFHLRGLTLIDERLGAFYPLTVSTSGRFKLVHSGDVKIYENLDALPRAYVVHRAETAPDDETILALLQDPAFDPAASVVLAAEGSPPLLSPGEQSAAAEVSIALYEPERVVVVANLARDGYLILSDTHYPGWRVTVDGAESRIHRANLMFRAVYLPAGAHTVEFQFQPRSLYIGACASALALVLLIAGLIAIRTRRPC